MRSDRTSREDDGSLIAKIAILLVLVLIIFGFWFSRQESTTNIIVPPRSDKLERERERIIERDIKPTTLIVTPTALPSALPTP